MPTQPPMPQMLHRFASACPPLINSYRKLRDFSRKDEVITGLYRKFFERGRLELPILEPEKLCPEAQSITLPVFYPLFAGEDAPLNDLIFLLNLAKGLGAQRILEVGTYRARTTYALQQNCPEAQIISYDIQILESSFRQKLLSEARVELRHASFSESASVLRTEPPFDLIFVDGSHQFENVLKDSELALQLIGGGGVVVWHDYRPNDYSNKELKVPEALNILKKIHPIYAIPQTFCAVHRKKMN